MSDENHNCIYPATYIESINEPDIDIIETPAVNAHSPFSQKKPDQHSA